MAGNIHISSKRPDAPDEAAFALYIEFDKGGPRPQRVFQAADAMIRAMQRLDKALCVSIDSNIEPLMVLEEIEVGSIKVWLANILTSIDDQALKGLDWKPIVGKYLVRAKYAYIKWSNSSEPADILGLAKELRQIAAETDVRHLPDYAPPSAQELVEAVREVSAAKSFLTERDRISYISPDGEIDFDLSIRWAPEDVARLAVKETASFPEMSMNLIVKRPDYLGASKWELRHGKKTITARIEDEDWLRTFQNRQIDVRPGDALRCIVRVEHHYGYDNELISETYTITEIEAVLENHYQQLGLDGL